MERKVSLASQVLEGEEAVDRLRDQVFDRLLSATRDDASLAAPDVQFLLVARHMERIADHATNIAEDVVFWLRGLDIRHGRANSFRMRNFESNPVDL